MTSLLVDHLRSVFTQSAVTDLARVLGEQAAPTQKAIDGLLPAITSGVINKSSTQSGASTLYQLLKSTPFDADPSLNQLVQTGDHRQRAAESGNSLLGKLFDDRPQRLAEATAQYSGVGAKSATTLTGLVMSVLMGFLHKQITTRNLTDSQLVGLLRGDTDSARQAVPAGLAGLLGWFMGSDTSRTTTTVPPVRPEVVDRRTDDGTPWWRWLLYLLIPLLLLFLLLRSCNGDEEDETGTAPTSTTAVTADTVASDLSGSQATESESASAGPEVRVGVDLPGGRKLNVAENSFNYSLANFLSTKGGQTPKVFTFDNLTFETNSAQITAKARPNVNDLIQIMQAYPTLTIRIEGHTDSTGDDDLNDPLSGERAEAVKQELVQGGIAAKRVATRERGDTKPVASNKTEEGREKNRRIDVIVTKI